MRSKEKVTLKRSKKDKEWITRYPDWDNRNGRITGRFFFGLLEFAEKRSKELGYDNLNDYFRKGGFDPDTFTISINAKLKDEI